ncbi:hypothetical protein LZ30DRAFT_601667 [Colletotrichum cereale]|nr:hypothetical protein LZ30DRAFT_601667 [Colletotrichum cereale]
MRTSSTKSSSNTYSNSNSSGPTSASSSTSLRNCMDVDTDSYDDGDCECTETALQILEQVVTPSVGGGWAMAENNILLLKNNISRCLVLSKCRECRQESGICMLTLVIYEKLTASFEGVAQWWGRQRVEAQGSAKGRRERQQQKQQTQIAMGRYQIDTAEEHRAVFATIIAWQLQRLSGLAVLMVEHSKQTKWRAHVEYSEAIRRRITILEETWKC